MREESDARRLLPAVAPQRDANPLQAHLLRLASTTPAEPRGAIQLRRRSPSIRGPRCRSHSLPARSRGPAAPTRLTPEAGVEVVEDLGGLAGADAVAAQIDDFDERVEGADAAGGLELDVRGGR